MQGNYNVNSGKRTGRSNRRLEAEFIYVNARGRPHMRVVRFDPKDFAAYHPDGHGEWLPGAPSELVLYHLHDLVTADAAEPVHLFEGERKADVVAEKWGLLTTCNPFGAGKWEPSYTETLSRFDTVYVHADNDAAGRKHGAKVAASVAAAGPTVKVVELPVSEKGDVLDYMRNGGTREDFLRRCAEAPVFDPATAPLFERVDVGGAANDLRSSSLESDPLFALVEAKLPPTSGPNAKGWYTAHCPWTEAHANGDGRPSFGYTTVGYKCQKSDCPGYKGGSLRDLAARLGIETYDAYDAPIPEPSPWPKPLAPEAFYGLAGEIARAIDPYTEAPTSYILATFLTAFGAAAGSTAYAMAEADHHPARLFTCTVGETAKGRKGTAYGRVRALMQRAVPIEEEPRAEELVTEVNLL